jgi:hypothetical protein
MSENLKKIPFGINDFETIVKNDYLYVDKTQLIYHLIKSSWDQYFLSRPIGFGKTLLISALEAALRGRRELFKGLWIDGSDYDFKPYPVIRLSLGEIDSSSEDALENGLISALNSIAENEELTINETYCRFFLESLFEQLYAKRKRKVALLIDDCDTPILKQIDNLKLAKRINEKLFYFFNCFKDGGSWRGFILLSGTHMINQDLSLSSCAFHNLNDITFKEKYANICGFTVDEFDALFSDRFDFALNALKARGAFPPNAKKEDLREKILEWSSVYSWVKNSHFLNPSSILHFFDCLAFNDYRAKTSSHPAFLINRVKTGNIGYKTFKTSFYNTNRRNIINLFDKIKPELYLFKAGYISSVNSGDPISRTKNFFNIPNLEVRASLAALLFSTPPVTDPLSALESSKNAFKALSELDVAGFRKYLGDFLATLSFEAKETVETGDAADARSLYIFLAAAFMADQHFEAEIPVKNFKNSARVYSGDRTLFIFEIKHCPLSDAEIQNFGEADGKKLENKAFEALRQMELRRYERPYLGKDLAIYKVAVAIGGYSKVFAIINKEKLA